MVQQKNVDDVSMEIGKNLWGFRMSKVPPVGLDQLNRSNFLKKFQNTVNFYKWLKLIKTYENIKFNSINYSKKWVKSPRWDLID